MIEGAVSGQGEIGGSPRRIRPLVDRWAVVTDHHSRTAAAPGRAGEFPLPLRSQHSTFAHYSRTSWLLVDYVPSRSRGTEAHLSPDRRAMRTRRDSRTTKLPCNASPFYCTSFTMSVESRWRTGTG
jgi:hypothetical protein